MAASSSSAEIRASLVLLGAAVLALILANSGAAGLYKGVLDAPITLAVGTWSLDGPVKDWIKNALMAVFFLYVGLEIKYEFREGALSDLRRAILPFAGAAGGMTAPAAIYLMIPAGNPGFTAGWAIPSATDIAFAVGVVGLLGARVPMTLKAFLLAVAVIDDVGAILIIALFYTAEVQLWALGGAAAAMAVLLALNLGGVRRLGPYMLAGLVLWVFFMESGVSATLAGVLLALFIPLRTRDATPPASLILDAQHGHSPLHALMARLKFSVLFVIMPIFALANAGVPLGGIGLAQITHPVTAGIALGLFLGKPLGIVGLVWVVTRLGIARLPDGTDWLRLLAVSWIAGIGFTMSLFIGPMAMPSVARRSLVSARRTIRPAA
ncbi:Na+/H+ antiporter NhaA [Leptolyngbya sp. 15MV]|nr:Na+/H+ antiporter NhaA [Leptolyngbya sp. 15MV]